MGDEFCIGEMKIAGERIGHIVLFPGKPLGVVRHSLVVKISRHRPGDRQVERVFIAEA